MNTEQLTSALAAQALAKFDSKTIYRRMNASSLPAVLNLASEESHTAPSRGNVICGEPLLPTYDGGFNPPNPLQDDPTNDYRPMGNDPINNTDPTGLEEVDMGQSVKDIGGFDVSGRNVGYIGTNCVTGRPVGVGECFFPDNPALADFALAEEQQSHAILRRPGLIAQALINAVRYQEVPVESLLKLVEDGGARKLPDTSTHRGLFTLGAKVNGARILVAEDVLVNGQEYSVLWAQTGVRDSTLMATVVSATKKSSGSDGWLASQRGEHVTRGLAEGNRVALRHIPVANVGSEIYHGDDALGIFLAVVDTGTIAIGGVGKLRLGACGRVTSTRNLRVSSAYDDVASITGKPLSSHQANLLARLEAGGGQTTLKTGEITTTDIAALTRHATESGLGGEFALIRTVSNERKLVQLGRMGGTLPGDTARLILHSHPGGQNAIRFGVSGDDVAALASPELNQNWSLIVNSEGTVARFNRAGDTTILKQYLFDKWRYPQRSQSK